MELSVQCTFCRVFVATQMVYCKDDKLNSLTALLDGL